MAHAEFTARRLDVGGLSLHYLDWDGDGPPLVMLHGYTSHARDWDHTAAALSGRYRVLALDARGHGDSQWASRYGVGLMTEDLLAFLDALRLGQVTLMGLSMGGIVAFLFTASHPGRVTDLIVLDIGPEIAAPGVRWIAAHAAAAHIFSSEDEAVAQERAFYPRPTDQALRHRVRHNLRPLPDGTLTFKYDDALRQPGAILDRSADELWAAWRAVSRPVLLARGDDSEVLAAATAQRMLAENPHASLAVVPDCGHVITLDNPQGLLDAVNPWLAAQAESRV